MDGTRNGQGLLQGLVEVELSKMEKWRKKDLSGQLLSNQI